MAGQNQQDLLYVYRKILDKVFKNIEVELREFKKQLAYLRFSKKEYKYILHDLQQLGLIEVQRNKIILKKRVKF